MSRAVHLGLDVGGTASRWVACDAAGAVLARGQVAGATGHIFNPAEKERLSIALRGIALALADAGLAATSLAAGITGYGSTVAEETIQLVSAILELSDESITLMDDIILAYIAHFAPGEGHLISAGTGSIGIHVGADGKVVRVGGRGILIDDAGSGSWIALQALDQTYRVLDREGSFGSIAPLARQLFAEIGGNTWSDVRQFVYAGDRGRIGSLAIAVARAAEEGDAAALGILRNAGAELAQLAAALLGRCGGHSVRFTGGVLKLHPVILEEIGRSLVGRDVRHFDADAALAAAQLQAGGHAVWRQVLVGGLSLG